VCTSHEHGSEHAQAGAGRRSFLRATALLGAAATAGVALPTVAEAATGSRWRPDTDSRRFTLAVMPDTQYLFDGPSIDKAPVEASLRYLLEHGRDENLVFLSHLGDLTQNGAAAEVAAISEAFRLLDRRGVGYSVLAGNHDVKSSTDDQRGATPYLDAFGPDRFKGKSTYGGASSDGYNTFHLFQAAGREWMVLALDWRLSAKGYAWAKDVLAQHPKTPVILTTHELVVEDDTLSTSRRSRRGSWAGPGRTSTSWSGRRSNSVVTPTGSRSRSTSPTGSPASTRCPRGRSVPCRGC
jgi:hypothetical protein